MFPGGSCTPGPGDTAAQAFQTVGDSAYPLETLRIWPLDAFLAGGAAVLHDIGLGPALREVSNPTTRIISRTVYGLKMMDIDVPYVIKKEEARSQQGRHISCCTYFPNAWRGHHDSS